MNEFKAVLGAMAGTVGACLSQLFGGWSANMTTLCIFMLIDYLTGLLVAGVFHNSPKSETGALESKAGWKGLVRKGVTLAIVLIGARLDIALGVNFAKDGVIYGFMLIEALSILENAGLMGIKYPAFLTQALDLLNKKADKLPTGGDTDDE